MDDAARNLPAPCLVILAGPGAAGKSTWAAAVHAGTVADHVGRFRELAEAGAAEVMIRLPDLTDPAPLERMAKVISAFR